MRPEGADPVSEPRSRTLEANSRHRIRGGHGGISAQIQKVSSASKRKEALSRSQASLREHDCAASPRRAGTARSPIPQVHGPLKRPARDDPRTKRVTLSTAKLRGAESDQRSPPFPR